MRIAAPLLVLAALAAAPALAQKPGVDDLEREAYRGRGISLCLVNVAAAEGVSADDAEAICGCALDRFMPRWPTGALPAIGTSRFQTVMAGDLLSCTAEQRPALAAAVARRLAGAPAPAAAAPPPALEEGGKPVDAADAPDTPEAPGAGLRDWLERPVPAALARRRRPAPLGLGRCSPCSPSCSCAGSAAAARSATWTARRRGCAPAAARARRRRGPDAPRYIRSTSSLASARPRSVAARTSLIASILPPWASSARTSAARSGGRSPIGAAPAGHGRAGGT